ncbi:MAG: signal peptidase II [Bacteroidota bacterium]
MMRKKAVSYFLIAFAIVLLDQGIKFFVKLNMELGEEIPLIGNVVKIHFIENNGAAFGLTFTHIASGLGFEMSEETAKLILSLFSLGALGIIGSFLYHVSEQGSALSFFVAIVFGGAMGNIIDRTFYGLWFSDINTYEGGLFHGQVVDMLYVDVWSGYLPEFLGGGYYNFFPIINLADAAISIGVIIILLFQKRFFQEEKGLKEAIQEEIPVKDVFG